MANPINAISVGCLRRVFAGESVVDPVVQCVQIKPMPSMPNGQERYRVVFNDTINFIQSMIAQRECNRLPDGHKLIRCRGKQHSHGWCPQEGLNLPSQELPGELSQG